MERKAFYEIPKPPKKSYAVIVREIKSNEASCQHGEPFFNKTGAYLGAITCGARSDEIGSEVYECPCCGVDTCDDHLSKATFHGDYLCKGCAKLTSEDIEKIQKLRLELNH